MAVSPIRSVATLSGISPAVARTCFQRWQLVPRHPHHHRAPLREVIAPLAEKAAGLTIIAAGRARGKIVVVISD
jgi:hypothetical protein